MDRAEAIKELTQWRDQMKSHGVPNYGKKLTALDLAIESLMLRDKYVKALERMIEGAKEINRFLEESAKKSDEKLQLSPETSTISEETSTNSNKNIKDNLSFSKSVKLINPCSSLLKPDSDECKEQKSKLDCISRQQAINEVKKMEMDKISIVGFWELIESLPPVTPTVKVRQVDTLIIATALQDLAQNSKRNISDRERAEELREQVLAYGAKYV